MHKCPAIKLIMIIFGFIVCTHTLQAQRDEKIPLEKSSLSKSYPIDASERLWKKELEVRNFMKQHPDAMNSNILKKASAWGFTVGSTHSWYADDLSPENLPRFKVPSTCRAAGSNCYVFVEDASWTSGRVTQQAVDSVRIYFDSKTPISSAKGIYQTDVDAFGNPPNVDNDPKIIILMMDIQDGYNGSGGYVEGYFYSFNEINPANSGYATSNFAEIFYLDTKPLDLNTTGGLYGGLSTLAHEFQHMIHFNYTSSNGKPGGDLHFIDEGCSVLAEVNCGFPIYSQSYYASEPNHYLLDWRVNDNTAVLTDYSRAARFFVYMRDQAGMSLFKNIVASPLYGVAQIDAGFQAINSTLRFADILKNWFIANILDDRTVDPKYGYLYPNLPKPVAQTYLNPNVPLTKDTVNNFAVHYISFKKASQLKATFTVSNPALLVKAVEIGPSSKRVLDVTSGVEFSEPLYGSTYTEIDFAVMNTDPSVPYTFTYQASGIQQTVELGYPFTEPIQASIGLVDKDSICVVFDAVQDGKLDSIRVALRRDTYINGGIWKYTGSPLPTPLGQKLTAFTVKGLSTPSTYPIPWTNWATVDLRTKNISTNSAFAVGFIIDGTYPDDANVNRVMIAIAPSSNGSNSLSYDKSGSAGSRWYFYVTDASGDSAYYYLIRAYVSFGSVGVRQTVELQPATFNLSQNYPNPFNPSTRIQFVLPSRNFVTLKVYDLIGRDVATLVNGFKEAGSHEVLFDASHLPSGIYLYRITTDKFVETKKLVLIK
jgi:hypothetical protein